MSCNCRGLSSSLSFKELQALEFEYMARNPGKMTTSINHSIEGATGINSDGTLLFERPKENETNWLLIGGIAIGVIGLIYFY